MRYLVETGPQPYSALLAKFRLQTGTLNHHLEMLKELLEQGEDKRYSLNRNGYVAYELISYAKASLSKPMVPKIKGRRIIDSLKPSALAFYKILFHPTRAFKEVRERLAPYLLCSLTVLALSMATTPSMRGYAFVNYLSGLLAVLFFPLIFVRLVYGNKARLLPFLISVFMSYLPTIILNILTILFATLEFSPWIPLPFIIVEDPAYIALMEIFAALFVWRFVLLFLAIRESFKVTVGQSFLTVFASSIVENLLAFVMDYLFRILIILP
ncbi:hypothetical protein KEJ19_03280 [Candidatus Bathyarchaeota archaeon]|nr:hypothetical protein [Candidatus Bathyarchaeota archaeon]